VDDELTQLYDEKPIYLQGYGKRCIICQDGVENLSLEQET